MDVLIMSDTHGDTSIIEKVKNYYPNAAAFIHCGDSELPAAAEILAPFTKVGGNCDYDPHYTDESIIEVSGKKIYITHGHLYGVKSSITALSYRAEELAANIVCFGHSHILGVEKIGNQLYINPGSLKAPRGRKEKTFVLLQIHANELHVKCLDENNNLIAEFKYEA